MSDLLDDRRLNRATPARQHLLARRREDLVDETTALCAFLVEPECDVVLEEP